MDRRSKIILISILLTGMLASVYTASAAENPSKNCVTAYYFHGSFRCPTCRKLEQHAKESIKNNFKKELADGSLIFKAVNVEEEENEHFIKDYQLYTKALVLSLVREGKEAKYKNLDKVWEYVRNKTKYMDYIKDEINNFLKDLK